TGTVHFTKSDGGAGSAVPADYTFVAGDNGAHTFTNGVTFVTASDEPLVGNDTMTSCIAGSAGDTASGTTATHFTVSAPARATAGSAWTITVTALDASNGTVAGSTGTVHFTKTDSGAGSAVPADYTFVSGDNGAHTFTNGVTFVT